MKLVKSEYKILFLFLFFILLGVIEGINMQEGLDYYVVGLFTDSLFHSLFLSIVVIDYLIYLKYHHDIYLFRSTSFFQYFFKMIKEEMIIIIFSFFLFHFSILFVSGLPFFKTIFFFIPFFFTQIISSFLIISILSLVHYFIKKKVLSSIFTILCFIGFEMIYEHYSFHYLNNSFDISLKCLFVLPDVYLNIYLFLLIIMLCFSLFLFSILSLKLRKHDFLLEEEEHEKN